MNMNDRLDIPDKKRTLLIPLSSVIRAVANWAENRRIKRDLDNIRRYTEIVIDYKQES